MSPLQWQEAYDALNDRLPEGVTMRPSYSRVCLVFKNQKQFETLVSWVEADKDLGIEDWRPDLERLDGVLRWRLVVYVPWKSAALLGQALQEFYDEQN